MLFHLVNMKIFFVKISFLLLIITFLSGCRARSFSHTQDIIPTEFANFKTFLNNKKISLDTIYLDKDNIKSIEINEQKKTVHITQKKENVEYFSPQTAFPTEKFQAIVIDGEVEENLKRIEAGAIKSISILRDSRELYSPITPRGTFLLITLK